jgi:hypothetical protein
MQSVERKKGKVVPVINYLIIKPWRRIEAWSYNSDIIDLSNGWSWVISFTPRPLYVRWKGPRYSLDKRLGAPQSRTGRCGVEKNYVPVSGIDLRQSSLYPVAIRTELPQLTVCRTKVIDLCHFIVSGLTCFYSHQENARLQESENHWYNKLYMEQSPSWEAKCHSLGQGIPCLVRNTKECYSVRSDTAASHRPAGGEH